MVIKTLFFTKETGAKEIKKQKTCYMCGGDVERRIVEGVIVKDVPVEVCTRCGEKYYNTKKGCYICPKSYAIRERGEERVSNRCFQSVNFFSK